MATFLIAGASGTVGSRLVAELRQRAPGATVLRGSRSPEDDDERPFDLTNPTAAAEALRGVNAAFLMLPPGLSDAGERFRKTLDAVDDEELPYLVFMSVQGAESRGFLPHAHVERAVRERCERIGEPEPRYTLLRPAYFMQNLEQVFGEGIRERGELVAPLGEASLVWVDAADIARAAATIMRTPRPHAGHAYAITGADRAGFAAVAQLLSAALGRRVAYRSPGPLRYFLELRRAGRAAGGAAAQTAIHFAERFTADAPLTTDYSFVTGEFPFRLEEYVQRTFGNDGQN